jgi:hypothetical protein
MYRMYVLMNLKIFHRSLQRQLRCRNGELTPSSWCEFGRPVSNDDIASRSCFLDLVLEVVEELGKDALLATVQRQALSRPPWARVLCPQRFAVLVVD